uniref:Uncharacterized protein n=1 Tax=Arundo donax TaxID=35708 RepID=A0A0A9D4G9_ARUDO
MCQNLSALLSRFLGLQQAVYQKTGNIFFRKSVKSAVTSEQKQLDLAKDRLNKLDQA